MRKKIARIFLPKRTQINHNKQKGNVCEMKSSGKMKGKARKKGKRTNKNIKSIIPIFF